MFGGAGGGGGGIGGPGGRGPGAGAGTVYGPFALTIFASFLFVHSVPVTP